jgi:hypothetical protein
VRVAARGSSRDSDKTQPHKTTVLTTRFVSRNSIRYIMKTCNCFIVAVFAAALLIGCGSHSSSGSGSGSSPSKTEIENAVAQYVGMARSDIGDVKLDEFKIVKEYTKKVGTDEVFFREFDAHYTVTYQKNPSKHSFEGTIAMLKQGDKWVARNDLCTLSMTYSPPVLDAATQATLEQPDPGRSEEAKQKLREQARQTNQ